jgi:hypothetical protein
VCLCEFSERNNEQQLRDADPYYKMLFYESVDEDNLFEIAKVTRRLLQASQNFLTLNYMTYDVFNIHFERT